MEEDKGKPIKCEYCGNDFNWVNSLRRHTKKFHPGLMWSTKDKNFKGTQSLPSSPTGSLLQDQANSSELAICRMVSSSLVSHNQLDGNTDDKSVTPVGKSPTPKPKQEVPSRTSTPGRDRKARKTDKKNEKCATPEQDMTNIACLSSSNDVPVPKQLVKEAENQPRTNYGIRNDYVNLRERLMASKQMEKAEEPSGTSTSGKGRKTNSKGNNMKEADDSKRKIAVDKEVKDNSASAAAAKNRTALRRNIQRPKWLADADQVTTYGLSRAKKITKMDIGNTATTSAASISGGQTEAPTASTESKEGMAKTRTTDKEGKVGQSPQSAVLESKAEKDVPVLQDFKTEPEDVSGGKATESGGKATESGMKAAESGMKATESGMKATESVGKATESGGKATESGGKATESGGKATESGGKATESGMKATESGMKAMESGMKATESGMKAAESGMKAAESGMKAAESGMKAAESGMKATESEMKEAKSEMKATKSGTKATKPGEKATEAGKKIKAVKKTVQKEPKIKAKPEPMKKRVTKAVRTPVKIAPKPNENAPAPVGPDEPPPSPTNQLSVDILSLSLNDNKNKETASSNAVTESENSKRLKSESPKPSGKAKITKRKLESETEDKNVFKSVKSFKIESSPKISSIDGKAKTMISAGSIQKNHEGNAVVPFKFGSSGGIINTLELQNQVVATTSFRFQFYCEEGLTFEGLAKGVATVPKLGESTSETVTESNLLAVEARVETEARGHVEEGINGEELENLTIDEDEDMPLLTLEQASSAVVLGPSSFDERGIDDESAPTKNYSTIPHQAPTVSNDSTPSVSMLGQNFGQLPMIKEEEEALGAEFMSVGSGGSGSGLQQGKSDTLDKILFEDVGNPTSSEKDPGQDGHQEIDSDDSILSELSEFAERLPIDDEGVRLKEECIRFLLTKVSASAMWRIRQELLRLKRDKNYFKFGKLSPLAASLMHDIFCQSLNDD